MWFCNDSMDHTWTICSSIKEDPNARPKVWPIARGTNLQTEEIRYLERGGFILQKAPFEQSTNDATPRYQTCVSQAVATRIDAALALDATVKGHSVFKPLKHEVFKIETENSILRGEIYNVDIAKKPACSCRDFMD